MDSNRAHHLRRWCIDEDEEVFVLVLHEGRYFLVKALNVDQNWLSTDDVVWCSKNKRPRGYFWRGRC